MFNLALPLVLAFFLFSCGSTPSNEASGTQEGERKPPSWIKQPARTVDGGYIVYVGVGEDHSTERSHFKAEAMALQDLSNECSFAPKGTRIEDHFDETEYGIHKSYAKVAVEFQECEAAKSAVTPEEIRSLASTPFAEQVKKYQELIDNPEPQEAAPLEVVENESEGGNPVAKSSPSSKVVVINDAPTFFIYRQQVAYVKQDVILAPPAQYPHGEPQSIQPIQTVAMTGTSIRQFETANPELRTGSQTFSNSRPNWSSHQPTALRQGPAPGTVVPRSFQGAKPGGTHESQSEDNLSRATRSAVKPHPPHRPPPPKSGPPPKGKHKKKNHGNNRYD